MVRRDEIWCTRLPMQRGCQAGRLPQMATMPAVDISVAFLPRGKRPVGVVHLGGHKTRSYRFARRPVVRGAKTGFRT